MGFHASRRAAESYRHNSALPGGVTRGLRPQPPRGRWPRAGTHHSTLMPVETSPAVPLVPRELFCHSVSRPLSSGGLGERADAPGVPCARRRLLPCLACRRALCTCRGAEQRDKRPLSSSVCATAALGTGLGPDKGPFSPLASGLRPEFPPFPWFQPTGLQGTTETTHSGSTGRK